jgi:hypothetical protein
VRDNKRKRETKAGGSGNKKKWFSNKKKKEEANEGVEIDNDDDEHIVFTAQDGPSKILLEPSEKGFNFEDPNVSNSDEFDELLIYYNWLADSATT